MFNQFDAYSLVLVPRFLPSSSFIFFKSNKEVISQVSKTSILLTVFYYVILLLSLPS